MIRLSLHDGLENSLVILKMTGLPEWFLNIIPKSNHLVHQIPQSNHLDDVRTFYCRRDIFHQPC